MVDNSIRTFLSFFVGSGAQERELPILLSADDARVTETLDAGGPLLLVNWRNAVEQLAFLQRVSDGHIVGLSPVGAESSTLEWSSAAAETFADVAGMRFKLSCASAPILCFETSGAGNDKVAVLASIDDRPWLVRVMRNGTPLYLLGISSVPDLESTITSEADEPLLLSMVVPILLILRKHAQQHVWAPGAALGNFIIDDPLLKPRYGFVDHQRLADQVRSLGAAATIAFIPWNARRSHSATVSLYKRTENLSLCVHGHEHTAGEFATTDLSRLSWHAVSAIRGMELHEQLTGLPFEPVMVFPQGTFSEQAMEALAAAGFLAAINSHFLATNHSGAVRLKHLIEPAITSYRTLPLFLRRYPSESNMLRYDRVLGRPLLMVEHHQYFRDGGSDFIRVIGEVQKAQAGLRWLPTGEIAKRVHLIRRVSSQRHQVRFYGDHFVFRPSSDGRATYEFQKPEIPETKIVALTINSVPFAFEHLGDRLTFAADLNAGCDAEIRIVREAPRQPVPANKACHIG